MQFNLCWPSPTVLRKRGIKCYETVSLVYGLKPLHDSGWTKFFLVVFPQSLANHTLPSSLLLLFSFCFSDIYCFQQNPSNIAPALNLCCCPLPPESMAVIAGLPVIQHTRELTSATFLNAGWGLRPTAMLRSVLQGLMLEDNSTQVIRPVMTPCTMGVAMLFQSPSRGLARMTGPRYSHLICSPC